jgi:hypothetical protein
MDKSRPVISSNLREDALLGNASGPLQAPFPGRLPEAMEDCGLPDCGVCEDFASLSRALVCREILPADVSEGHGRPECGAGARIAAAEDGGGVVADGEQARDRLSLDIENARARVRDQAVIGRNVSRNDLYHVERRNGDGANARVRGKILVAEQTLIGRRPAIEGAVMALGGGRRHQNDGP